MQETRFSAWSVFAQRSEARNGLHRGLLEPEGEGWNAEQNQKA